VTPIRTCYPSKDVKIDTPPVRGSCLQKVFALVHPPPRCLVWVTCPSQRCSDYGMRAPANALPKDVRPGSVTGREAARVHARLIAVANNGLNRQGRNTSFLQKVFALVHPRSVTPSQRCLDWVTCPPKDVCRVSPTAVGASAWREIANFRTNLR
jgi:hypothetical protein